jgi:hypothetical protein
MSRGDLVLNQSTEPSRSGYRRYGAPKRKRHLHLTDEAHAHLVKLAEARSSSPSEVCEQIIRAHALVLSIPTPP